MQYSETTALRKIAKLTKRLRIVQGGTSASKTISVLIYLIARAQSDKTPTLTSIVSESFPHLRRGAIRDFLNIMEAHGYFKPDLWSKTDYCYTFETGSKIEFFSADQPGKVRGPRRDRLFINEANNVPFETYEQLEIRTKEFVIIDYNPTNEFFVHEHILGKVDHDFLVLTYRDNEALDANIVAAIESRKHRAGWWKVYGEGLLGEVEGRIYTGWQTIDAVPHEARLERYGVDFGYHPDPCAIVALYYLNGGYILDEVCYQLEMSNREIANTLKNLKQAPIIADSAEPKSIAELKAYGLNVLEAQKGKDSVKFSIKSVQDQRISVTKNSVNLLKEYRNYLWDVDKDGKIIPGVPAPGKDHLLDASRYAVNSLVPLIRRKELYTAINTQPKSRSNVGV